MGTKLSAIASGTAPATTDTVIGVQGGTTDVQFTLAQVTTRVLTSPTIASNLTMSGANYIVSDVAFSGCINLNAAAVQFGRAASPTNILTAMGDYGGGQEGVFIRTTGAVNWTNNTSAAGTVDTQLLRGGVGLIKFGSAGSFSANNTVATVLGSVGPTGSHTTVQTWLTIVDSGGTTRYIPCF